MGGSVSQNDFSSSFAQPTTDKDAMANADFLKQISTQFSGQQQGFNGNITMPGQGGQPQIGAQNPYSNTVGQWDNSQISPVQQQGKGKGA